MKANMNDYFVIGNYKANGGVYYSIMWLDTGARALGYKSRAEAYLCGMRIANRLERGIQ